MNALVKVALEQVVAKVEAVSYPATGTDYERLIAKAINSVDTLKSALKAL